MLIYHDCMKITINKTLTITTIPLVAVVMGMSSFVSVLADPSSVQKDNACVKDKNSII